MRWLVLLSTGVSNTPGGGYLHWRPPSVVLLQRWSCLNFSSRNWDEEGGRLCVKMAVGGKCGKFSGSSVGYLAGGGWQTFHCIEGEQARDRGTSVIGRTLPSTLSCSLGPHLKSLELELRQRVTEDRAATHQKKHQLYMYARSTFLTATAAMAEDSSLFEGAHLTGGDTRFCHKSSKSRGFLGVKSSNSPCESF